MGRRIGQGRSGEWKMGIGDEGVGARRKRDIPYLARTRERSGGERLYPNCWRALCSSEPSMEPDLSASKCLVVAQHDVCQTRYSKAGWSE